jgi:hypothetical protein
MRRTKQYAKTRQNTHVYLLQVSGTVSGTANLTNQYAVIVRYGNDFLQFEHFTQLLKAG